jgi:outer membrane protein assembly factor BamB
VVFGGDAVFGMDPATGRTIWQVPWKTSYSVNAATPVYRDGQVFVTSSYGMGCMMIEVTPSGARKKWSNKLVKSKFQPVVLDGDFLYANSEGNLTCLSWSDGSRKWRADGSEVELGENGSILRTTGDKLVALSDGGKVSIVQATPDGHKVLGAFQAVQGDKVWSSPLLYGGRLYVKGPKELVCFDIAPAGAAGAMTQPAGPGTRPADDAAAAASGR